MVIAMLIELYNKVTNYCNKTHYCQVYELDGSIRKEIWGKAHDCEFLKDTLKEEVHFFLSPLDYVY